MALLNPYYDFLNPDLSLILQTYTSDEGVGAILSQTYPGVLVHIAPVAYASQHLRAVERNYTVTEKEALAIQWAVPNFEVYLCSKHFHLPSDHHP